MGYIEKLGLSACLAAALTMTGCAKPTGYERVNLAWASEYGYQDRQIDEDEFGITVTGNIHTSRQRAADIALLRAAHITREQGRTHFLIRNVESRQLTKTRVVSTPVMSGGVPIWIPIGETMSAEPYAVLIVRLLPVDTEPPSDALVASSIIEDVGRRLDVKSE